MIVTHYFICVGQDQEEDLKNFHLFLKYLIYYEHIDDGHPQADDDLFVAAKNFTKLRVIDASIKNLVEALDLHVTFAARLSSFYDPPLQTWWNINKTATISTIFDCSSLTPRDDQTYVPSSAGEDELWHGTNDLPQPIGNQQQQQQQQPSATATKKQVSTVQPSAKKKQKLSCLRDSKEDSQASTGSKDGIHDVFIGHPRAPNGASRSNATQEPKSLKKLTEIDWVVKFTGCKKPDDAYLKMGLG